MRKFLLALALLVAPGLFAQTNTIPTTSGSYTFTGNDAFTHLTIPSLTGCLSENSSGVISGVSCAPSSLAGNVNGAFGTNTVNGITIGGTSVPFVTTGSTTNQAPLVFTTANGGQIIWGPTYVPSTGGAFTGAITGTASTFSGLGTFQSIVISGLTPGTGALCADGTNGAITNVGCATGFVSSFSTNGTSGLATLNSGALNIPHYAGSGSNTDITSLSDLTTPLSIAQGGTGNVNGQAVTALALAAEGTQCANGLAPTGVDINGNALNCQPIGTDGFTYPGIVYATSPSAGRLATDTDINSLLQGLTGCSTAGYVYSPQSGTCIASSSGAAPGGSSGAMQYYLTSSSLGGLNGTGLPYLNGASAPTIATPAQLAAILSSAPQSITVSSCTGCGGSLPSAFVGQSFTSLGGTSYTPSYGNNFYGYPSIDEFGDSITVGIGSTGSSPYPNGYGQLLIADFGGDGTDYAVSGATSADVSDVMVENYNPAYTHNPAVTLMIGTNDINAYGGNTAPYSQDVAGLLEWATVPRRSKVFLTDSQCSSTGTWTNSTSYGFPSGVEISTVSGSTYTCTVVTIGPALYIGFMQDTAWTAGSMSITIDGSSPGTNPTIPSLNFYGNQEAYKFTAFRYPVSAGSHTVVFTVTSTSGTATGTVAPVWMGSAAPISTVAPPRIFVADVPPQENNANATDVALYNTALQAVENQLIGDGLPIQRVNETGGGPTSAGWLLTYNATTNPSDSDFQAANLPGGVSCPASTTPGFHPNNCGHAHLRDAFEYYIQPLINISHGYVGEQTVSSTGASFTGWNTQSTYNSGNSQIGFVAAAFNQPAYTGIYTTNQYGGNYAMTFDPSFNTLGPATFLPYLGIAYGVDPNTSNIGGLFQSTGANEITLGGGTGSANITFNLIGTLNSSIGLNAGTGNPFAVDGNGDSTLSAVTAATSTSAVNSPFRYWSGHYWNNSASAIDTWGCQIVFNTGAGYTNPESDLVCNGSGSSGAHYFKTNTVVAGTISSSVLNISASSGSQAGAVSSSQSATSGANYSSPEWGWSANYYNSSTSANATDVYYFQDAMGTGPNPSTSLKLIHTGSVGPAPSPGASSVDLTAANSTLVSSLAGTGSATVTLGPSSVVGTGATAACSSGHVCDSISGNLTLTTGTGTLAAGELVMITLPVARSNSVNCTITPFSAGGFFEGSTTTTSFQILGSSALTASTGYYFTYVCGGN